MVNLRRLSERKKEQRAFKMKNRHLKQNHDVKLAKKLTPITEKIDEVEETTQKVGVIIKDSNSENENDRNIPLSVSLRETLKFLANSSNSLKFSQDKEGNMSSFGVPVRSPGGD